MSTLHIINDARKQTLISVNDGVIYIENGVYGMDKDQSGTTCYALTPDIEARGLGLPKDVQGVDYTGFVELCTRYDKVVTW